MRRALALRMGYPRRVLEKIMTYAEFLDWCRDFAEAPFDDEHTVHMPTAKLQATLINLHKPADAKPTSWTELMPFQRRTAEDLDEQLLRDL